MRWSASYRARAGLPADTIDKADITDSCPVGSEPSGIMSALSAVSPPMRTVGNGGGTDAPHSGDCVSSITAEKPSPLPATEEPYEPLWPAPGTPEWAQLDRENAAICAGLLAGYHQHHWQR